MAVSQGKMLGHYTRGPGGYRCPCCHEYQTTRWRKRQEQREVTREIADYYPSGYSPAALLSARHDSPDMTGLLTGWESDD